MMSRDRSSTLSLSIPLDKVREKGGFFFGLGVILVASRLIIARFGDFRLEVLVCFWDKSMQIGPLEPQSDSGRGKRFGTSDDAVSHKLGSSAVNGSRDHDERPCFVLWRNLAEGTVLLGGASRTLGPILLLNP